MLPLRSVAFPVRHHLVAEGHQLLDFDLSVERIRAGKATADDMGVPFVINARTDEFLPRR